MRCSIPLHDCLSAASVSAKSCTELKTIIIGIIMVAVCLIDFLFLHFITIDGILFLYRFSVCYLTCAGDNLILLATDVDHFIILFSLPLLLSPNSFLCHSLPFSGSLPLYFSKLFSFFSFQCIYNQDIYRV